MINADSWVLRELAELGFVPYVNILPGISDSFVSLRDTEAQFIERLAGRLTKRQAVALGLLSRSFQLSISCLVNQLHQNYAGWNCSYRSLMETFFVIDWISQNSQRFEAYFEGQEPGIGRIKTECCGRHPEFATAYKEASDVTHVGNRALHLSRKTVVQSEGDLPFSASAMRIVGSELVTMLHDFARLLDLVCIDLKSLMLGNDSLLRIGEVLWDGTRTNSKFGCLGYIPRTPPDTLSDTD